MSRTKAAGKSANGTGSIRKITITKNSRQYTYWQARYTEGYDSGTGKQIQRSITGKSQKEVAEKLKAATSGIDCGAYVKPNKQTLGQWLDVWTDTFLLNIKPRTLDIYKSDIRLHIKPFLGAVRLDSLDAPTIQAAYIKLLRPSEKKPRGLSPKTIKNIHGVLHKALQQAVLLGYIRRNPADACVLPRVERPKIVPFDDGQVASFLKEVKGTRYETLFVTALFTGTREGEILGLTWDCVDFERNIITIDKQMQLHQETGCRAYQLIPTKNDKIRTFVAAPTIMTQLRHHQALQAQQKLAAGAVWANAENLVFTDDLGKPLMKATVYREFKKLAAAIGRPDARFHDLRHTFAVAAIQSGDDIKTIQENLGHATASFTLDVYGHVNMQMKHASAARMEEYIKNVSAM